MQFASAVVLSVVIFALSTSSVNAIIVIIPTVLVPIVHVVVWVIGALAAPVVSLTALYFKMKNKSLLGGILFGIFLLMIIGLLAVIMFKMLDPNRPIY